MSSDDIDEDLSKAIELSIQISHQEDLIQENLNNLNKEKKGDNEKTSDSQSKNSLM